ncbi:AraC family transcriptional regulator [Nocardia sp. NPDC058705]|uniref:AraC family transcriptional regulator n=1 Tax=Nocardia sp. NPDC058705 TaxID=3346609 RepID=UPI00369FE285
MCSDLGCGRVGRARHGCPQLSAAVELLTGELEHPGPGTDGVVPSLLDVVVHYALRTWLEFNATTTHTGWSAALRDPVVSAALAAIHQDPAHPWTVARLARRADTTRAPFAKRFADLTGTPPIHYLTWWRMTLAARALRTTDAPLTTIAHQVGYTSEFAFATAFKRRFLRPPGEYRRTHQRGE